MSRYHYHQSYLANPEVKKRRATLARMKYKQNSTKKIEQARAYQLYLKEMNIEEHTLFCLRFLLKDPPNYYKKPKQISIKKRVIYIRN